MADPAPPPGMTHAAMAEHCYAEGRALLAEGHKDLAEVLLSAGGYWWGLARKGRPAVMARLAQRRAQGAG